MAKQEVFGDQRVALAHGRTDQVQEKKQVLEHRPNIMPLNACSRPGRLLRPTATAVGYSPLAPSLPSTLLPFVNSSIRRPASSP
jgi:hypothetical protein